MPKLTFKGSVLPPGFMPDIEIKDPIRMITEDIEADFTIRVANSALEVECAIDKFDADRSRTR